MMQINAGDYYQRAPRCCPGQVSQATTTAPGTSERSLRIATTIRGAELLCCCCSCSTATSAKTPGLVASLGVCLLVFGYTLLGAFAFMALEGGFKQTDSTSQVVFSKAGVSGSNAKAESNGNTNLNVGGYRAKITDGNTSSSTSSSLSPSLSSALPPSSSSSSSESNSAESPSLLLPTHHQIPLEDSSTRQLRAYTVERLWSITEDLNVLYKENWTRLAEREVLDFQEKMAQHSLDRARSASTIYGTSAVQRTASGSSTSTRRNQERRLGNEKTSSPSVTPNRVRRWTFGSSFLYSLTLITTIGYGSTSPRTVWGRLITIIYALAGIPLMLVYLSTVGDVLARTFRMLYGRACGRVNCSKRHDRQSPPPAPVASTVPPLPGITGNTSYHHYDNHIESKLAVARHFYSNKSSSSDEVGLRTTGSAIRLDCATEDGASLCTKTPFQEIKPRIGTKKPQHHHHHHHRHHHHHHFYPCSQISVGGHSDSYTGDSICLVRIPISLCLVIILLYICCGAIMFNRLEGWSLLEGSYFCFTSLGTIGFGDLVPTGGTAPTHLFEELSLCACSLYILAGMGLVAMCFNLMQEEVVRVVRVFGRNCGMSSGAHLNSDASSPGVEPPDSSDAEKSFVDATGCANIIGDSRLPAIQDERQHQYQRDPERECEHLDHQRIVHDDDAEREQENQDQTTTSTLPLMVSGS